MRRLLVVLLCVGGLAGCSESPDFTVHEPGQYKGSMDPLLQQQAASRNEVLAKRFNLVQADR